MSNPIQRIKKYYGETLHEIKRCSWPNKSELVENTAIVLIVTALITFFVYVVDWLCRGSLMWFLEQIPEWLT